MLIIIIAIIISADLSLWLDSPMFWAPWHQSMSTYSQPSFSSFTWKRGGVWMCKLGVISQERLKIEVKFLLSANRKSCMPRWLAQQWMSLSDLEWPFHGLSAPSVNTLYTSSTLKSTSSASCAMYLWASCCVRGSSFLHVVIIYSATKAAVQ